MLSIRLVTQCHEGLPEEEAEHVHMCPLQSLTKVFLPSQMPLGFAVANLE